ncbi:aspartyl protease family protein 1-like [Vigna unguiculata]|uniref:Nucleoside-triphosphatase n=1 Tax=Vigna unguiculata TaxID=3917 RepID=A0A4D6LS12_VIGUN|nr:aspartyl protease family protein 1-like [Vigna unguiculata]QCD91148.1 nucleoside-triphosphatase [Vigna unguiculata]
MAPSFSFHHNHGHNFLSLSLLMLAFTTLASQTSHALRSFAFDIHHRFSDPVKEVLGVVGNLPDKRTREYYVVMAHRDRMFRGRRLAGGHHTPLTFVPSNETYQIGTFGFLHFANVSVGTPPSSFLVALDTGSDLFWLPCNCTKCVRAIEISNQRIDFSIYDPRGSSTSGKVLCNSSLCEPQKQCSSSGSVCPYEVNYLSNGTSTSGFLVDDVLHLITDDDQAKDADTRVTFGCGQVQTGAFLDGAAPNGLLGLGMGDVSVPSILAKEGLTSNSFSMCFGADGLGRITFGDNSSLVQGKTPFNLRASHPTYNVTVSQINLGGNVADTEFHAIFDSGTSFTYLNDPAYTQITNSFNSVVKLQRHSSSSSSSDELPFEYCYDLSSNQVVEVPINFTMKGGDTYTVIDPIVTVAGEGISLLCLGVVRSNNVNIIGQNFMTGYNIVFDRDNMVLGWKKSNCYDDELSTLPVNRSHSSAIPPAIAVNPQATSNQANELSPNLSFKIKPSSVLMVALFFAFGHILSIP